MRIFDIEFEFEIKKQMLYFMQNYARIYANYANILIKVFANLLKMIYCNFF